MVSKCSVPGCLTNHATGEKGTVFELPRDEDLQNKCLSSLNRDNLETQKHVIVCFKHCANHFVKQDDRRHLLVCSMNPFPTISPAFQGTTNVPEAERERMNMKTPRKPPTARGLQSYELQRFKQMDTIQNLEDIDDTCIKSLGEGFTTLNRKRHLITFKLDTTFE